MAKLPVEDLAKDWPLLVGNPENPDRVNVIGFEDEKGLPLKGCRVILETPNGETYRLRERDIFHLQITVRYTI